VYDPVTDEVALVADLAPGSDGSGPYWMASYDSALYVSTRGAAASDPAGNAVAGNALWRVERTPPTSEEDAVRVSRTFLHPAFPNPFADATTLRFELPVSERVRVEVYDLLGRRVALLADGTRSAGEHTLRWDGRGLPTGLYFVRLRTGGDVQTRRVALVR
jgi:hypothetical protein